MSNPGAKPNPSPSVRSLVRHGLTPDDRRKLIDGNSTTLVRAGYGQQTINDCIEYAQQMCALKEAS